MKLSGIITNRFWQNDYFWQIVYEWEDIFQNILNTNLSREKALFKYRISKGIPFLYDLILFGKGHYFCYDMNVGNVHISRNSSHLIPCIIDFWKSDSDILTFEKKYSNHKFVCISSREVFEYLKENGCRINIEHLPLSISDKYRITPKTKYYKKYDIVLMGRQSPVLMKWFNSYIEKHPEIVYVYSARKGSDTFYHYSSNGEEIGNIDTREKYLNLLSQGRVAFYSTPGTDGQKDAGGFSQVTPRFLEIIASGCHVMPRYIKNADTDYFMLDRICPSLDSYNDFEQRMDYALTHEVDMEKYSDYLENYYTSRCADKLKEILKKY